MDSMNNSYGCVKCSQYDDFFQNVGPSKTEGESELEICLVQLSYFIFLF